jgi:hypothetical protein
MTASETFSPGIAKQVCLAITDESVESLIAHQHGDDCTCRGFIHAIDSDFDPAKVPEPKTGYDGTFKIIDQLVWTDLYAMHVGRTSQNLNEYWSLAAEHPDKLYVGPTTAVARRVWRTIIEGSEDPEQDDESADVKKEL